VPRLRQSNTAGRGYHRVRSGGGFSYRDASGSLITDTELKPRFGTLGIPPAWTDVWICLYENGHVQATGIDDAGRRQYIYHPAWRERQDRVKFERALEIAAAFRMLDTGSLRIGSERYAEEHGSHGLSTLLCSHVTVTKDRVQLRFPAKSGQQWESEIVDADLAAFLRRRLRSAPAAPVLSWRDGRELRSLSAAEINDYVRERTGGEFTAKDFRTLRGTVAAAASLAVSGPQSAVQPTSAFSRNPGGNGERSRSARQHPGDRQEELCRPAHCRPLLGWRDHRLSPSRLSRD